MSSTWKSESWIAASWDKLSRGRHVLLGIDEWIFRERSDFQEVAIATVPDYGKGLFLDALIEVLEIDEFVYHEAFALTPVLFHPFPKRVLIAGGGDGLALREVLRDPRVEEVVMVEIDALVIEACKTYLPELHRGSFDDPRANIRVDDALAYLESPPSRFDVVLVDLLDGYDAASIALYQRALPLVQKALAPDGIVGAFGEIALPHMPVWAIRRALKQLFSHVAFHRATLESFSGSYGFLLASETMAFDRVPTEKIVERASHLEMEPRSLVPRLFPACFQIPRYIREALDAGATPPLPGDFEWIEPLA